MILISPTGNAAALNKGQKLFVAGAKKRRLQKSYSERVDVDR